MIAMQLFVTSFILILLVVQGSSYECYSCNDCDTVNSMTETKTCNTSCITRTSANAMVYRGCIKSEHLEICVQDPNGDKNCYCKTNLCNHSQQNYIMGPLMVLPLLLHLITYLN
ncbi:unnamed protein product [Meganyctiphanes norvegica]|uniref:Uncharacterized protein n=1 Tax=Meganyctiphanes norvegica TaxID=48144 RepID=A0AAV2QZU1_MEGNR